MEIPPNTRLKNARSTVSKYAPSPVDIPMRWANIISATEAQLSQYIVLLGRS